MMDSNSNRYLMDIHGYSRIFDRYWEYLVFGYSDIKLVSRLEYSNIKILWTSDQQISEYPTDITSSWYYIIIIQMIEPGLGLLNNKPNKPNCRLLLVQWFIDASQSTFFDGSSYIQKGSFFVIYRTLQISIRFSMVIFCKNHSCSCDALIRCDI